MLLHRKCHQKVVLDLSPALKFVSAFGFTSKGLNVNMVNMIKLNTGGPCSFVCTTCNVEVPRTELDVFCQQCGRILPAVNAVMPLNSGGVCCSTCGQAYYDGKVEPLNIGSFTISKDAIRQ